MDFDFDGDESLNWLGHYECTVDERGRLRMPQTVREQLGENRQFFVTADREGRILMWRQKGWSREVERLLGDNQPETLELLSREGDWMEMDLEGRLLLPPHVRKGRKGLAWIRASRGRITVEFREV